MLINFEVYEGAELMEKKEYVGDKTDLGEINKALYQGNPRPL